MPTKITVGQERQRVGLCVECLHMRRIVSDRAAVFFLCGRSAEDSSFAKYPRLPVLQCPGFEPGSTDEPRK